MWPCTLPQTDLLLAVEDAAQCDLKKNFENIASEVHSLQKFVSDSTLFLTPYDIRNSQQVCLVIGSRFFLMISFMYFCCVSLHGSSLPCVGYLLVSLAFNVFHAFDIGHFAKIV